MASEHDDVGDKYKCLYVGSVIDNADPLGLHRVTLTIPGLIEVTDWVFPIGIPGGGGGTVRQGFYFPPAKGASVAVFFHAGDPEKPRYMPGNWGIPASGKETPGSTEANALPPAERVQVQAIETAHWLIEFDNRTGAKKLVMREKRDSNPIKIELDGEQRTLAIDAPCGLAISSKGTVDVRALNIVLNGRPVLGSAEPI